MTIDRSQQPHQPTPSGDLSIAVDGGTTNVRARLMAGDNALAIAHRPVGLRDAVRPGGRPLLLAAIREVIEEVSSTARQTSMPPVVAAGMLGTDAGLGLVPHVVAPAGFDELAQAARWIELEGSPPLRILVVPGVRIDPGLDPQNWTRADLVRGEECQVLALWNCNSTGTSRTRYVWLGSHTKLLTVDHTGRIVDSFTTLGGELAAAVVEATVVGASLPEPWPELVDESAFRAGVEAERNHGLLRAAFLVRVSEVTKRYGAAERAAFWIGAIASADAQTLATALAPPEPSETLWIGGRAPRPALMKALLAEIWPGRIELIDDQSVELASAWGATEVLRRRLPAGAS